MRNIVFFYYETRSPVFCFLSTVAGIDVIYLYEHSVSISGRNTRRVNQED